MMTSILLYCIAAVCILGAIQERKDLMRLIGFFGVAMIFVIVGLVIQYVY